MFGCVVTWCLNILVLYELSGFCYLIVAYVFDCFMCYCLVCCFVGDFGGLMLFRV